MKTHLVSVVSWPKIINLFEMPNISVNELRDLINKNKMFNFNSTVGKMILRVNLKTRPLQFFDHLFDIHISHTNVLNVVGGDLFLRNCKNLHEVIKSKHLYEFLSNVNIPLPSLHSFIVYLCGFLMQTFWFLISYSYEKVENE